MSILLIIDLSMLWWFTWYYYTCLDFVLHFMVIALGANGLSMHGVAKPHTSTPYELLPNSLLQYAPMRTGYMGKS